MSTIRKRGSTYQVQVRRKGRPQLTKTFHRRSDALQWARQCEVGLIALTCQPTGSSWRVSLCMVS